MLWPFRIKNAGGRAMVSTALGSFTDYVLVWKGSDQAVSPTQPQHRYPHITPEIRQEVVQALNSQTDLNRHIWIATVHCRSGLLGSLLHAVLEPDRGARVDLLLAFDERNDPRATAYDGFGEILALMLELEHLGITRMEVPLQLDVDRTGMTAAGWSERTPGVFTWGPPRN